MVTNVSQNGKQLTISLTSSPVGWFQIQLFNNQEFVDIFDYCTSTMNSITCSLPSVGSCNSVSLWGSIGIGGPTVQKTSQFSCTVVAA
ncbi:hypothetical protein DFA_10497 [Cavenderia fasciculata]|uniref:Carbohydrate binding domain-containing protein n=1 Tax=Cavenderia fasciculata TaxID=261658 RepID=F4QAD6_CACFS|nr:uncharacterized protein DFA_10497 [Cavenderia fasciculata]EGG15655.1 hypothetical protein DFA_10497 [Cavenderia fasciculata]|eukprot:XP_004354397.1 hypothetical protein DFA_10497 [Cavenderia fasciculata]